MNEEILKCQSYLHPEKPVDVTSEDVKAYLKELGWNEGDKIPSGMAEYTTQVLTVMQKPVSIKSLKYMFEDETVKATLISALNKTKVLLVKSDNIEQEVAKLVPNADNIDEGSKEALLNLAKTVAEKNLEEQAKIDADDSAIDGLEEIGDDSEAKEPEPIMNINDIHNPTGAAFCPRCGFDTRKEYNPFPTTDTDRLAYAYCILGGTDFSKTYKVADGLLEITYTIPSAYVQRMIEDQLKYDAKVSDISYDQAYVTSVRYGLAASLTNVKSNFGVDNNEPILGIHDERFKDPKCTPMSNYTKYIESQVIRSGAREVLFRSTYADFVRLQVQLQHEMQAENFMRAVLDKKS